MTRTLLVTPAEVAAGWIVRPGVCPHRVLPCGGADCCCHHAPPADLRAAAAPCAWCGGTRGGLTWNDDDMEPWGDGWQGAAPWWRPCLGCRIELFGECPTCEGKKWHYCAEGMDDCQDCRGTGTVIIGYAYAVSDVLPIVEHDTGGPCLLAIRPMVLFTDSTDANGEIVQAAFAHYGDPATLVGQYALQIAVTA